MSVRNLSLSAVFVSLLWGCSDAQPEPAMTPDTLRTNADATLTVTADINMGIMAKDITVIPNDVAPWLSHIVVISEDGELYQTALDSGEAKPLGARAVDAIGLMRMEAPGVVLTLSEMGGLDAYIESNDAGELASLPVNGPDLGTNMRIEQFCSASTAPSDTIYAVAGGSVMRMAILVEGTDQIRLSKTDSQVWDGGDDTSCVMIGDTPSAVTSANPVSLLGDGNDALFIRPLAPNDYIAVSRNADDIGAAVSIGAGLSTEGLSAASASYVSNDSLGGVFRDGAIILADANAPRLVLISKPFAQKTLADLN